jgi:predicted metalloprotease with PDZ domain
MRYLRSLVGASVVLALGCTPSGPAVAAPQPKLAPIDLAVDATDAARGVLHAHMTLPARPGELALLYPKWIPGEHGPTGPLVNVAGLRVRAAGSEIPWRRDSESMYEVRVTVPAGASSVDVDLDFAAPSGGDGFSFGGSSTSNLAVLSWNQVLLYPKGFAAADLTYQAKLHLPDGWKYGTALPVASEAGAVVTFQPVSLVTLVDSPVAAGRFFRSVPLDGAHRIDVVADSAEALEMTPQSLAGFKQLVAEGQALFGAHHYADYHFLLTLSDGVAHFGLEHHASSDNRVAERALVDDDPRRATSGLLPHEFVHSWNGKFRRPRGLATPDYDKPMKGDLLWIYEGLTNYLGFVLQARSGLRADQDAREALAATVADLDVRPGRLWRSLEDTAVAAQVLYDAPSAWRSMRRGVDFYPEGTLLWLEVDVLIRQKTNGQRSIDDFCKSFFGQKDGPPEVVPYDLKDIVEALGKVAPNDWNAFFDARVMKPAAHPPLGGITGGGWQLVYDDKPNEVMSLSDRYYKRNSVLHSLGLLLDENGGIEDVIPDMPAARAGLGPQMTLVAVGGRRFSKNALHDALVRAKDGTDPIEMVVQSGDFVRVVKVDYHGGARYPHLVRDSSQPDLLAAIMAPKTPRPPDAVTPPLGTPAPAPEPVSSR